uniref:Uncharacterized protein n=1 Tax=Oryza nivara TaxID=4536 RepID=A0A0E0GGY2_ORYNI
METTADLSNPLPFIFSSYQPALPYPLPLQRLLSLPPLLLSCAATAPLLLSTAAFFPRAILSSSATHTPSSAASYFLRRHPAHKVARSGHGLTGSRRGLAGSCGDGEQRSSLHLAAAGNSGVIGGAPLRIWRRRGAAVAAVSSDDYQGDRPDEAKHGAPAPPTRGLGLWLRGSRAQARRFDRFLCKRGIGLQSHGPH